MKSKYHEIGPKEYPNIFDAQEIIQQRSKNIWTDEKPQKWIQNIFAGHFTKINEDSNMWVLTKTGQNGPKFVTNCPNLWRVVSIC